jgi:hypothetical protein
MVDEDTGQPPADRALDERRGHRRVDPAGQATDRPLVPHLATDRLDLLVDDVAHGPGLTTPRDVVQETLEHPLAVLRVQHLGVPLDAREPPVHRLERRDRGPGRRRQRGEPRWRDRHGVAVAHPHPVAARQPRQQRPGLSDVDERPAELGHPGTADLAAQRLRHRLEAITDAEHRHARLEDGPVEPGGSLGVHRLGTTAQDDRLGAASQHLRDAHRVRHDLGVDACLTDPPGDQLGVLRPEVDDKDEIMVDAHAWPPRIGVSRRHPAGAQSIDPPLGWRSSTRLPAAKAPAPRVLYRQFHATRRHR